MYDEALYLKADELSDNGNFAEAFEIFLRCAQAGCAYSMLRIGSMYIRGEGVNCDYDKAIEWEHKAVESGEVTALLNLGISYRIKGEIVKAKYWFEQSVVAGDGSGALELAKLYMVSSKEKATVSEYLDFAISAQNMCEADIEEEAQQLLRELLI